MSMLAKEYWRISALFAAFLVIAPIGISQSANAAGATAKKVRPGSASAGHYSPAPKPRVHRRGTRYNFTNWERDTTHEGYDEYYDGRFRFFEQRPRVGYTHRRY